MNEQPVVPDQQTQNVPVAPTDTPQFQQPVAQPENVPQQPQPQYASPDVLEWQASEYVMREKNTMWFVGLGVVTAVMMLAAIFLLNNWLFAVLLVVMAITVFMFAHRPARDMSYRLSHESLQINDKNFRLDDFRAFGVVREGGLYSITMLPLKRFVPGVSLYFPPEHGEAIVDLLGSRLPMEELEPDFIDQLTEKLRF